MLLFSNAALCHFPPACGVVIQVHLGPVRQVLRWNVSRYQSWGGVVALHGLFPHEAWDHVQLSNRFANCPHKNTRDGVNWFCWFRLSERVRNNCSYTVVIMILCFNKGSLGTAFMDIPQIDITVQLLHLTNRTPLSGTPYPTGEKHTISTFVDQTHICLEQPTTI